MSTRRHLGSIWICAGLILLVMGGCQPSRLPATAPSAGRRGSIPAPVGSTETADTSGPVRLTGIVRYTSPDFLTVYPDPYVTLFNLAEWFAPDALEYGYTARKAQVLGRITSDPARSPFLYELLLPIEPRGPTLDVDQDDVPDRGVQIYSVAIVSNLVGDPYLDTDLGDSLSEYSSARWGEESNNFDEIVGGKLLVYAPDANQGFPTGFGADGLLFTADDPVARLPRGYTVVDLDATPFRFDRSPAPSVNLLEPASEVLDDFSHMGYADAFNALIDLLTKEYAFTDYYQIDWNALRRRLLPRVEAAESARDYAAYVATLYDLVQSIPDGHVSVDVVEIPESVLAAYAGSLGLVLQEIDDGRVFVTQSIQGLPAARAGIQTHAEILALDGTPIRQAIRNTEPFSESGFASDQYRLLQQMIYVERGPVDSTVEITYRNPAATKPQTVRLTRVASWDALLWPRFYDPYVPSAPLPLTFDLLPSGYGLIQLYRFWDDLPLTIHLWRRAIETLNAQDVPGVIIDLRYNEGGYMGIAELMAAYLLDEEVSVGSVGYYARDIDDFYFDENPHIIVPLPDAVRYHGNIVLLIGPDCASACEFFSYALTRMDDVEVMGYYSSLGLGGFVEPVAMPDDVYFYMTTGRAVDAAGKIHIEGVGIAPTIPAPVTEEAIFSEHDILLAAAETYLDVVTEE